MLVDENGGTGMVCVVIRNEVVPAGGLSVPLQFTSGLGGELCSHIAP